MSNLDLESIWNQISERLRAFIARRVPDAHLADDLLHDTFLRIHQGIGDLREEDRVLPWIYTIARSVITDHFRKKRPDVVADLDRAEKTELEEANLNADVHRWLTSMIDSLPETYREAVRLSEIEGLLQRDVARALDISVSGAKSRVQRGRQLLREQLLACCHLEFDAYRNVVDYEKRGGCAGCEDC